MKATYSKARCEDLFWSRVRKTDHCWTWLGAIKKGGYGHMVFLGKLTSAHRIVWSIVNGDIPHEMHVCHTCDNPSCVNPSHLFLGTHQDNMRDRDSKGRCGAFGALSGELNHQAILTSRQASEIRALSRLGVMTAKDIGAIFGVSEGCVYGIKYGRIWRTLPDASLLTT